jgi:hypothetical protein
LKSTKPEERQDDEDHDHEADDIDDAVHDSLLPDPASGVSQTAVLAGSSGSAETV